MIVFGRSMLLSALVFACGSAGAWGAGDVPAAPQSKTAGAPARTAQDDAAALPRYPIKDPAESQRAIVARPGFRVELVAAEPLLRSPVAIDFDEDGRLFVAEFPEYNQYAGAQRARATRGCVRLLEDTRGTGVYDRSTVFADNVPMATAVACWDGGVYVGSAPDLLYLKDTDGDGKADVRRVVFTGFGTDRAGEGMLNSIRWGLDNRFHVATSLDGGSVRRAVGDAAQEVTVRGNVFVFDPRGETFELAGGGGQHGMTMDDWGRTFVCGNSDPFHLVMYDSRYLARNRYLRAPAAAINIAPGGKFTRLHRESPVEPWRILRTQLRSQGKVPGSDEGGSPSGFFTGATGVTVYRGDAFPPEFAGNLFVGEVSNNLIHRAIPEPRGVLVTARSAEQGREFVASRDCYFRPVQMAGAPDGCLVVVDICRELIEGAAFLPAEILQQMDVASGVDRGRIWRIVPDGHRARSPRLGKATTAELVALLEHADGWHRDTASRLSYQRQDRSAVAALRRLAATSGRPIGRATALSALAGLGALGPDDVLAALGDTNPRVREHALRLAEPFVRQGGALSRRLAAMTDDPDMMVRYQLAFSLGALPGSLGSEPLVALAVRDASDPWMRLAILSSVTGCVAPVFERLADDAGFRRSGHGSAFLAALAGETGAAERPVDLAAIVKVLEGPLAAAQAPSRAIVLALLESDSQALRALLSRGEHPRVRAILDQLLDDALATANDPSRSPSTRAGAVRTLRYTDFARAEGVLAELLAPHQPLAVQTEAVLTLAEFENSRVPAILLRGWREMSPRLKATSIEALFSRPAWLDALLQAVEKGLVGRGDIDPARLALLRSYPDSRYRERANRLFLGAPSRRQDVVATYQKALELKGDPLRGKEVFKANCSTCHRLEGVGTQIGAELAAVRDRGLDAVLLNILDPNREVLPQYVSYVLVTKNGRVLTGMIAVETANSLTIRQPDGHEETVLRFQIDELRSTGLSYMPEGLERQIDVPSMADLLAYLNSIKG
jgi:putative membrane-bound dehydrogenase-like protein